MSSTARSCSYLVETAFSCTGEIAGALLLAAGGEASLERGSGRLGEQGAVDEDERSRDCTGLRVRCCV